MIQQHASASRHDTMLSPFLFSAERNPLSQL